MELGSEARAAAAELLRQLRPAFTDGWPAVEPRSKLSLGSQQGALLPD